MMAALHILHQFGALVVLVPRNQHNTQTGPLMLQRSLVRFSQESSW